jgi:site-specific DNA-adenine methylase
MKTLIRYAGGKSKAIKQITPFIEKYDKIIS